MTIPAGITSVASALRVNEPNILAIGTVANAVTVYITGAPTEGTNNYALWVVDGVIRFDDDLKLNGNIISDGEICIGSGC